MTVTYVSEQTTTGTGTSAVVSKPASTASGDLLIAAVNTGSGATGWVAPSGWTAVAGAPWSDSNDTSGGVWYKVAGGSEPSTYTWSWTNSGDYCGSIKRVTGASASGPIRSGARHDQAGSTGASFSSTALSGTQTSDLTLVIAQMGDDHGTTTYTVTSPGAPWTTIDNFQPATSPKFQGGSYAAGSQSAVTFTSTSAFAYWNITSLAIVSAIPGAPQVVQSKALTGAGSGTLSGSFTTATTAGNCIIVALGFYSPTAAILSVSSVTLGGVAGNFGQVVFTQSASGTANTMAAAIWADPNCAGGQTSVSVTVAGGSAQFSAVGGYVIYEVSGLAATLAALTDKTSTGNATTGTTTSSGATATTTNVLDFIIGSVADFNNITTDPVSWNNTAEAGAGYAGEAGYQVPGTTGTFTYSAVQSTSSTWASVVAALLPPPVGSRANAVIQANPLVKSATAPMSSQVVGTSIGAFGTFTADIGTETDALTVPTVALTLADSGTMTDTPLGIGGTLNIPLADSGTATDAITIIQPTPLADGGTEAEALFAVTLIVLADGGALADVFSSIAAVTLADGGTLTDPTVFGGTFSKFMADGGAETDLLSGFPIQLFDGGTGVDTTVFLPPPIFLNGEGVLSLVQEELAHPSARWFIPGSPRNKLKLPRPSTTPASPFVTAYIGIGSDPAGDSAILNTYTPKKTTVNYTVLTWASGAPQEGANEIRRE